jgi:tight adherence protein B
VTQAVGMMLAGLAAVLALSGSTLLLPDALGRVGVRMRGVGVGGAKLLEEVLAPLRRAGAEGRDATRHERRRLRAACAAGSLMLGLALLGPLPAVALATLAAVSAPRWLVWRRERFTRALGEGVGAAATRIADALASGHTTRAAIAIAAGELTGPIGHELSRVAADLELGATTDSALGALRARAHSRRVDLLVAAIRLGRRSGGNLAALLRDVAAAVEDQTRLEAEARAETAQARFTSTVVLAMPFFVLALGELAAPGTIARLTGSSLGLWLLGCAAAMQAGGAVLVRRLARVDA